MRRPACREAVGSVRETDQYIMRAGPQRATTGVVDVVLLWLRGGDDVAERLIAAAR